MPVEGDDRRAQTAAAGATPHVVDHDALPEVHAVVRADGDHAAGIVRRNGPPAAHHLPATRLRRHPCGPHNPPPAPTPDTWLVPGDPPPRASQPRPRDRNT